MLVVGQIDKKNIVGEARKWIIRHSIVVNMGRGLQLWRENKVVGDTYLIPGGPC